MNAPVHAVPKNARIYVAGHRGLVGSAIVRALKRHSFTDLIAASSGELDLRDQTRVSRFFTSEKPEYVYLAAARVGGIVANNTYEADFIYDNLMIEANVIRAAHKYNVKKLLFIGSTCIYPRLAPQPMKEEYLLTGSLEPTNESYAVAKIAGVKLCQAFNRQYGARYISALPTNLYGPGDSFDLENGHVLPVLIRKFHEGKIRGAPSVAVWGTGEPFREFCHVDECAEACVYLMSNYESGEIINIGVGKDIRIGELAELVKKVVGYKGDIVFDTARPDGAPRKLLDVSKINALGWTAKIPLEDGIRKTYEWYLQTENHRGEGTAARTSA